MSGQEGGDMVDGMMSAATAFGGIQDSLSRMTSMTNSLAPTHHSHPHAGRG